MFLPCHRLAEGRSKKFEYSRETATAWLRYRVQLYNCLTVESDLHHHLQIPSAYISWMVGSGISMLHRLWHAGCGTEAW